MKKAAWSNFHLPFANVRMAPFRLAFSLPFFTCSMTFTSPEPDELPGYLKQTLALPPEDDGELVATLVYKEGALQRSGSHPPIIYLHGFIDYFFHTHVAEAFERAGFRFAALDLRRYGRSLRANNRPNYATRIDDYFPEISAAIEVVGQGNPVMLVAHSTGALAAAIYSKRGPKVSQIQGLIFNSPFLKFPTTPYLQIKLEAARLLGKISPRTQVPQRFPPIYGKTLHESEHGSWSYDLSKKPLHGFPFYAGWISMVCAAQDEIRRGLGLRQPVLVLHSAESRRPGIQPVPEDFHCDTVLRVEDMVRLSKRFGPHVHTRAFTGGLHDLTLSSPDVRSPVIEKMIQFAKEEGR